MFRAGEAPASRRGVGNLETPHNVGGVASIMTLERFRMSRRVGAASNRGYRNGRRAGERRLRTWNLQACTSVACRPAKGARRSFPGRHSPDRRPDRQASSMAGSEPPPIAATCVVHRVPGSMTTFVDRFPYGNVRHGVPSTDRVACLPAPSCAASPARSGLSVSCDALRRHGADDVVASARWVATFSGAPPGTEATRVGKSVPAGA